MHWTGKVKAIAFSIGNIDVAWYGIIITSAMLLGLLLATKRTKRVGINSDEMLTLFLCVIPLSIVAARLGYVVSRYEYFFVSPFTWDSFVDVIAIWEGGLTILWGVPGGAVGALIWAKVTKKSFIDVADIVLPIVLLCQAIGRWGNFFNQELYGQIITDASKQWFPLAVYIAREGAFFQATFFYEAFLNVIGFVVLSVLVRRIDVKGFGSLGYAWWYCLVRGSLEFIRDDGNSSFDGDINLNIIFCYAVVVVVSALIAFLVIRQHKKGNQIWYKKGIPAVEIIKKGEEPLPLQK